MASSAKRRQSPAPDAKFPFQSLVNVTSVVRVNNAEICKSENYPRNKIFLFAPSFLVMPGFKTMQWQCRDRLFIINCEMMSVVYKQQEAVCEIFIHYLLPLVFVIMENSITANDTLTNMSVLETLGLLFYVASPSGTSFERIEECPDFVNQVN